MVKESSGLIPDCFGKIRSFSEKIKTCCHKVTVQPLSFIPGDEKLVDSFSYTVCHLFQMWNWHLLYSEGSLPEHEQFQKIISRGLRIEMSRSFNMRMLIMSWPWALLGLRFLIILYIPSFENTIVSKMLLVYLEHQLSKVIFFNKVHCSEK